MPAFLHTLCGLCDELHVSPAIRVYTSESYRAQPQRCRTHTAGWKETRKNTLILTWLQANWNCTNPWACHRVKLQNPTKSWGPWAQKYHQSLNRKCHQSLSLPQNQAIKIHQSQAILECSTSTHPLRNPIQSLIPVQFAAVSHWRYPPSWILPSQ